MPDFTVAGVVEEVNDWKLFEGPLSTGYRVKLGAFLADRQGQPGSYHGLIAPVEGEIKGDYRFVTGERVTSDAGSRHILGEEALRALILLDPPTRSGQRAIEAAREAMDRRLDKSERANRQDRRFRPGWFCCNRCSVALWRALVVNAYPDKERRLNGAMRDLKSLRDDKGGWQSMPFYYTLSALTELGTDLANRELRYARPALERRLKRGPAANGDVYKRRQRRYLEKAMQIAESK